MTKSKHTFAKRQREMGKKQKAEEKRARRQKKKDDATATGDVPDEGENTSAAGEGMEVGQNQRNGEA